MARFGLSDSESEGSASDSQSPPPVTHGSRKRAARSASTGRSHSAYSEGSELEDEDEAPPRASLLHSEGSEDEDMEDEQRGMDDSPPPRRRRALTASSMGRDSRASTAQTLQYSSGSSSRSNSNSPERGAVAPASTRQQRPADKPWASKLKLEPKRVAVMQASFFQQQEKLAAPTAEERASTAAKKRAEPFSRPIPAPAPAPAPSAPTVPTPALDPSPFRPYTLYSRTPLASSITHGQEGNLIDLGLSMGRSYRVGHGPNGEIVKLAPAKGSGANASLSIDKMKSVESFSSTSHLRTLTLQLSHTAIYSSDSSSSAPSAEPSPSLRFTHFVNASSSSSSSTASPSSRTKERDEVQLWQLGQALFDEIDDLALPATSSEEGGPDSEQARYIQDLRRRRRLEAWLEDVVRGEVEEDLRSLGSTSSAGPKRVFSLLTGHQIERAVEAALEAGDMRLATLVAQAGGDDSFREDLYLQLAKWREYRVDSHISPAYRRVYELLCGNVGVSEGRKGDDAVEEFKVAEGLGWKRALGLHLWYGTFGSSVATAVERYETALKAGEVASPLPSYLSSPQASSSDSTAWCPSPVDKPTDPLFQLLKLFTSPTHSLESTLLPRNFGSSPMDYRLSWHLYILFSRVLRRRDFEDRLEVDVDDEDMEEGAAEGNSVRADLLTVGYADQLERNGMWEWSAFVLLHLELPDGREKAIRDLLTRNASSIDDEVFAFLTETLKLPPTWIYSAQATVSTYNSDPFTTYKLLMAAEQWTEAHEIVVNTLAPEAVIRGDMKLLRRLFDPIDERKVENWEEGGKTFLDYILCLEQQHALHAPVAGAPMSHAESSSRHAHLLSVIDAVQMLAARKDLQRKERIKLKVAVAEMSSRLVVLARAADEYLARIQPSTLGESDRLNWIAGANAGFLANSLKAACTA